LNIEVIIGEGNSLKEAIERVKKSAKFKGITIIGFDTSSWKANVELFRCLETDNKKHKAD